MEVVMGGILKGRERGLGIQAGPGSGSTSPIPKVACPALSYAYRKYSQVQGKAASVLDLVGCPWRCHHSLENIWPTQRPLCPGEKDRPSGPFELSSGDNFCPSQHPSIHFSKRQKVLSGHEKRLSFYKKERSFPLFYPFLALSSL